MAQLRTGLSRRDLFALAGAAPESEPLADSLARDLDRFAAHWDKVRAGNKTRAAIERRNRFVRERLREMLAPLSADAPLRAEVTRVVERDGYRIENLLYQSREDLWVTANLYVPAGRGPFPAVVSPCGHYEASRMHPDYQAAYVGMVRSGFIVLAYDPTGQGERKFDNTLKSVEEHSLVGHLLLLAGDSLTACFVRDGMRSIDYLLSRPEVDRARIGCAGHSGGGTMAMYLSAADERVRCVAIHEGGTEHYLRARRRSDGSLLVRDAEQNLFPAAVHGIDSCDLHMAIAPRPLLATIENYAPEFNGAAQHIRRSYELLGAADRFATEEAKARHAWTAKLRIANTDWFCRWFYSRRGPGVEAAFEPEAPETLNVTPVGRLAKGITIFQHADRVGKIRQGKVDLARLLRLPKRSMRVRTADVVLAPNVSHLFGAESAAAYMAWLMDREVMGMRVATILDGIRVPDATLEGDGARALCVLFAAVLDRRVSRVVCRGGLLSYRMLAQSVRHAWPASVMVRGLLRHTDLPEIAASIAPRRVVIIDPVDGMLQPVSRDVAVEAYRGASNVEVICSG